MRAVALATLLAVLAAPAHATEQIVNYENVAIKVRGGVPSAAQVREAIMAAGKARQWQFTEDSPGRLSAVLRVRDRHEIHVLIPYDQRNYSVLYESSVNMSYRPQGGTIHANYNRWVRDFVRTINLSLSRISGDGGAPVLAAPKPPQAGDNWTYRITDPKRAQGERSVFVQVVSVSPLSGTGHTQQPALIVEHVSVQGGFTQPWRHARGGYLIPQGVSVFSPYLPQFEKMVLGEALGYIESTDPGCRGEFVCQAKGTIVGEETLEVAAGRFVATKVVIEQTWRPAAGASGDAKELERMHGARTLTIWYCSDLKRAVKYESRLTSGERAPMDANFDLELVSYQVKM